MRDFFYAAIRNVYQHGDTDIYPFPIENRIVFDMAEKVVDLLQDIYEHFSEEFAQRSPDDIRALVAASYSGFRWGAQLDPIWNLFLLGCVLSIAEKIEEIRLPKERIYSYRLDKGNYKNGTLFDPSVGWREFIENSIAESARFPYVVTCDIADCYARISHHKLENYLRLLEVDQRVRFGIVEYIKNFTGTRSAGIPVGGPASRILAELALNGPDQLMAAGGVNFFRFADDYHIFCATKADAHDAVVQLYRWLDNEGLSLQKSKTRILTASEFRAVFETSADDSGAPSPVQRLMTLTLRFDPYAPDAEAQYEALRSELDKIDIVSLLNEQLSQTRVHIPTARKIIEALRYSSSATKLGAAVAMLDNIHSLLPIVPTVLQTIYKIADELSDEERVRIAEKLVGMYDEDHEAFSLEINVAYMNRILSKARSVSTLNFLTRCFEKEESDLVRRDIILIFSNWVQFPWLSYLKRSFVSLSGWQRRALILASYSMSDEGKHWRDHSKNRFDRFELIVRDWRAQRANQALPI